MPEPELDTREYTLIPYAVNAVARNILNLNAVDKERVLLAVAVLYGIVKPTPPRVRKPKRKPTLKRTR